MPVFHQFVEVTVDGDTVVNLQGTHDVRIKTAVNTPKIIGFLGGDDGVELVVHNLSGVDVVIINNSPSAGAPDRKVITTGLGGTFDLPSKQLVWMIKVDPNDAGFPDADRGWYLDSGGQEVLLREEASGATSGPTRSSSAFAVLEEMSLADKTTVGGTLILIFDGSFSVPGGAAGEVQLFVDGVASGSPRKLGYVSSQGALDPNPSVVQNVSVAASIHDLAPGEHTFDLRWRATSGTLTALETSREIRAIEIP